MRIARPPGLGAALLLVTALAACGGGGPVDLDTSADACSRCRMAIDQVRHAGEIITVGGEVRKYDSLGCLLSDYRERRGGAEPDARRIYVVDYNTGKWIEARSAHYALADLHTDHMGYGVAALAKREDALALVGGEARKVLAWDGFLAHRVGDDHDTPGSMR